MRMEVPQINMGHHGSRGTLRCIQMDQKMKMEWQGGGCAPFLKVNEGYAFASNGGEFWNSFHLNQVSVFQAEMYSLFRSAVWVQTYGYNRGNRIVL